MSKTPAHRDVRTVVGAALATALFATAPTLAATPDAPGRYTMTPADGGMIRLDTATGAVSFCTRTSGDWSCAPVKDGEQALRSKIQSLEGEIVSLKDKLREMEEIAGLGDPEKEKAAPRAKPSLPSEQDVEQAFDYLERMMKKLKERMERLEGKQTPGTPL